MILLNEFIPKSKLIFLDFLEFFGNILRNENHSKCKRKK